MVILETHLHASSWHGFILTRTAFFKTPSKPCGTTYQINQIQENKPANTMFSTLHIVYTPDDKTLHYTRSSSTFSSLRISIFSVNYGWKHLIRTCYLPPWGLHSEDEEFDQLRRPCVCHRTLHYWKPHLYSYYLETYNANQVNNKQKIAYAMLKQTLHQLDRLLSKKIHFELQIAYQREKRWMVFWVEVSS